MKNTAFKVEEESIFLYYLMKYHKENGKKKIAEAFKSNLFNNYNNQSNHFIIGK